jgi:hypothetical protein
MSKSGWWATPNTMDHLPQRSKTATKKMQEGQRKGRSKPSNLREQVDKDTMNMFPTPTARDWKGARKEETLKNAGRTPKNSLPDAVASNLWPTPQARDWKGASGRSLKGQEMDLPMKVKMWPTPTTQEIEHPNMKLSKTGRRLTKDGKNSHSLNLADSVTRWPTPRVSDTEGAVVKNVEMNNGSFSRKNKDGVRWGVKLKDAVHHMEQMWPTPTANEDAAGTPKGKMQKMLGNHPEVRGKTPEEWQKGSLNPKWVEWLMGYPRGWTDLEDTTDLK